MDDSSLSKNANRIWKGALVKYGILTAALIVAFAAALPLWLEPGFLNTRGGGDSPFLLQRLHQLIAALADGHFPVRWMPDANYGFGYPFFNYYASLSIYVASLIRFLGFSYIWAIQLTQLAGFLVAAWSMFELGRRWFANSWAGLLASAAYTLAPFHMVNIYVRGDSLAEFWAMAFYPLVFLALDSFLSSQRPLSGRVIRKNIVVIALAIAALILSHNISALIFMPFVFLYLVLKIWVLFKRNRAARNNELGQEAPNPKSPVEKDLLNADEQKPHDVGHPQRGRLGTIKPVYWAMAALVLGLILAAWFWLPALAESSFAQLEPVTSGYFNYNNHFRGSDLIQSSFLFNYDPAGGLAFSMGLLQTILTLTGLIALLIFGWRNKSNSAGVRTDTLVFVVSGLFISTFLITPWSRSLWDFLPLLPFAQFPWRFLSIQAFFAALTIGSIGLIPGRRLFVGLAIALLLLTSLGNLKLDFIGIVDQDINAQRLSEYEWFSGNIGSTVSAEYLPETVIPRPYTSQWINDNERDRVQVLSGSVGKAELIERQTTFQQWRFDVQSPAATVTFPTINWPGWTVILDGERTSSWSAPGSGMIAVELPGGEHEIDLRLQRTPVRLAAEILSLLALGFLLWMAWPSKGWRPQKWLPISLAIVVFLIFLALIVPAIRPENDNQNWDFDQSAYLHQDTEGVHFNNGMILERYSFDANQINTGDTFGLTLEWNDSTDDQVIVDLVTPALNRFHDAPIVASQRAVLDSKVMRFELPIPENAPALPLLPRVRIPGAQAETSSGLHRGDLYLEPILVLDKREPGSISDKNLAVRPVSIYQRTPSILDVQLQWYTADPITRNFNFSMRVVDNNNILVSQFDNQPGLGFLPSSGWEPGHWLNDWLAIPLSDNLKTSPYESPFSLVVQLYDLESGDTVLLSHLGMLDWIEDELTFKAGTPTSDIPPDMQPLDLSFNNDIDLLGFFTNELDDRLILDLIWQSTQSTNVDYLHFVHLIDSRSGNIVIQDDAMPRVNTFPTSQWQPGDVVRDVVPLDTSNLASGDYFLFVGLYQLIDQGSLRAEVVDEYGWLIADGRVELPQIITIER